MKGQFEELGWGVVLKAEHDLGTDLWILVLALDDGAVAFYWRFGFAAMPGSPRVLYLLTKDAEKTITDLP